MVEHLHSCIFVSQGHFITIEPISVCLCACGWEFRRGHLTFGSLVYLGHDDSQSTKKKFKFELVFSLIQCFVRFFLHFSRHIKTRILFGVPNSEFEKPWIFVHIARLVHPIGTRWQHYTVRIKLKSEKYDEM